ncbi:MAG: hypothetical protein AAGJ86_04580 [Pseudomonadota bacterium]
MKFFRSLSGSVFLVVSVGCFGQVDDYSIEKAMDNPISVADCRRTCAELKPRQAYLVEGVIHESKNLDGDALLTDEPPIGDRNFALFLGVSFGTSTNEISRACIGHSVRVLVGQVTTKEGPAEFSLQVVSLFDSGIVPATFGDDPVKYCTGEIVRTSFGRIPLQFVELAD